MRQIRSRLFRAIALCVVGCMTTNLGATSGFSDAGLLAKTLPSSRKNLFESRALEESLRNFNVLEKSPVLFQRTTPPSQGRKAEPVENLSRFDVLLQSSFDRVLQISRFDSNHAGLKGPFYYDPTAIEAHPAGPYTVYVNPGRSGSQRWPQLLRHPRYLFGRIQKYLPQGLRIRPGTFNFTKISKDAVLFRVQVGGHIDLVTVNQHPLTPRSFLYVPAYESLYPQRAVAPALEAVLAVLDASQIPNLRFGFNSMNGLASVDHLHFHGYLENKPFAVDSARLETRSIVHGVHVSEIRDFPTRGLVFSAEDRSAMAREAALFVHDLERRNIPHNLYINRGKIYVYPWHPEAKRGAPSLNEEVLGTPDLSGKLVLTRQPMNSSITPENIEKGMAWASYSDQELNDLWVDYTNTKFPLVISSAEDFADRERVRQGLQNARELLSSSLGENYKFSAATLSEAERQVSLLLQGVSEFTSEWLQFHFLSQLMLKKMARVHDWYYGQKSGSATTVSVLVFDPSLRHVYLQKRGAYKRLYPGALSVSASGHQGPRDKRSLRDIAAEALTADLGIEADRHRLFHIPTDGIDRLYLQNYDFIAFSAAESERVYSSYIRHRDHAQRQGVSLAWSAEKRTLSASVVDPHHLSVLEKLRDTLKEETQLDPINPSRTDESGALFVYIADPSQEAQLEEPISSPAGSPAEILKSKDADVGGFRDWHAIQNEFASDPDHFALDLISPILGQSAAVAAVDSRLDDVHDSSHRRTGFIHLDAPQADDVSQVGGKGLNLHRLRVFSRTLIGKRIKLRVPEGIVVGTQHYDALIRHSPTIRPLIDHLNQILDRKSHSSSDAWEAEFKTATLQIREAIHRLELPAAFRKELHDHLTAYGIDYPVAVRSSATVEDGKKTAAAGQAETFLNRTNPKEVEDAIKAVWASLFDDGFVKYRLENQIPESNAGMAAVIQKMAETKAAGNVFSIEPNTDRAGFLINANFGPGESVVQGEGVPDEWFVGLDAKHILERRVAPKSVRDTAQAVEQASLTDEEIRTLSETALEVQRWYRSQGWADHIDVEFAVNGAGELYLLQTRPVTAIKSAGKNGNSLVTIETVDVDHLSSEVIVIPLKGNGREGVVRAPLQVLPFDGFASAKPGVILVTEHTNNQWNDVFPGLRGVITQEGNQTSHAAANSRESGLPYLVGASDAYDQLLPFNGKTVTFDSGRQMIFIGDNISITSYQKDVRFWKTDSEVAKVTKKEEREQTNGTNAVDHNYRWERIRAFKNAFEDFEGRWLGRPNIAYSPYQVDYYLRGWRFLPQLLNELFLRPGIVPCEPEAIVSHLGVVRINISEMERSPFIDFLLQLTLEDFEFLLAERRRVFEHAVALMDGLSEVTVPALETVEKELSLLFAWMHVGTFIKITLDSKFLEPQMRYVSDHYQPALSRHIRYELIKNEGLSSVLKMKWKTLDAIAELIREQSGMEQHLLIPDPKHRAAFLEKHYAPVWARITRLSAQYKQGTEDIRILDDTEAYLRLLHDRLTQKSGIDSATFIGYLDDYVALYGKDALTPLGVQAHDPDLDLLAKSYLRGLGWPVHEVLTESDWLNLRGVYAAHESLARSDAMMIESFLGSYATLHRVLRLSEMEQLLREDGHQYVTRFQRSVTRFLFKVAAQYPTLFPETDMIMGLEMAEVAALLTENNPSHLLMSIGWRDQLVTAENFLSLDWELNPQTAVNRFERKIERIRSIIEEQQKMSSTAMLKAYYEEQSKILSQRVQKIRQAA